MSAGNNAVWVYRMVCGPDKWTHLLCKTYTNEPRLTVHAARDTGNGYVVSDWLHSNDLASLVFHRDPLSEAYPVSSTARQAATKMIVIADRVVAIGDDLDLDDYPGGAMWDAFVYLFA